MDMDRIHPWTGLGPYFSIVCWIGLVGVTDMIGWVGLGPANLDPCPSLGQTAASDVSHKPLPSSRLTLLSVRHAVTFPASECHHPLVVTNVYCSVNEYTCTRTTSLYDSRDPFSDQR